MRCLVGGVCVVAYVINLAIADPIVKEKEKIYEKSLADHQAQTTNYSYSHEVKSQEPGGYENQVDHPDLGGLGGHGPEVINGLGQVGTHSDDDGAPVKDGNAGYGVGLGYDFSVSHGGNGHSDLDGHRYDRYQLPNDKVQQSTAHDDKPNLYHRYAGLTDDAAVTDLAAYQPSESSTVGEASKDRYAPDHKDTANVQAAFGDVQPGHLARYAISDNRVDPVPIFGGHIEASTVNVQPALGHYSSLPESGSNIMADYIGEPKQAHDVGKDGEISGNGGTDIAYAAPGTIENYELDDIDDGSLLELSDFLKSIDLGKLGKSFAADVESHPTVSKVDAPNEIETFKTQMLNNVEKPSESATFSIKVPNAPLLASFILPKIPAVGSVEKDKAPWLIHVPSTEVSTDPTHYDVKEKEEPEAGYEGYQTAPGVTEEVADDSSHENLEAPEEGDYHVEHISYNIGDDGHSEQYSEGSHDDDGGYGRDKDFGSYVGEFLKDYGDHNGHDSTGHGDYEFAGYGDHDGHSGYYSDYGHYFGHSGEHGNGGNGGLASHGGGGHHHGHEDHDHHHGYGDHGDYGDHDDHHHGTGHAHHDHDYYSHGSKGDKGHDNHHYFDHGDHGHHDSDHYRDFFKELGGHEKSHLDEASLHGHHHEWGKGEKGGHFGGGKDHKKGTTSSGYHNVKKKDEYTKDHTFYDNAHRGGHYTKVGDHDTHFHENDGRHKEGSDHDSSYEDDHFGKKHYTDKGHGISHDIGHDSEEGHHSHHDKHKEYGDKGATNHGTHHSFSNGDHDDDEHY